MQKDWGYAALIEYGGKRILFDTGNSGDILAQNAGAKGIDLSKLDFVVMSHRHGDHMGGLAYLLSVNPRIKIYAPKEGFGVYGGDLPSTFYRKDTSLPPEQRYYDGAPPDVMRFGAAWPAANFQLVDKNVEIAPGIHLIALVSDKPGTLELRELSLALNTPEGMLRAPVHGYMAHFRRPDQLVVSITASNLWRLAAVASPHPPATQAVEVFELVHVERVGAAAG